MLSGAGLEGQDTYLAALALVLTALGCGVGRSLDLSVSAEEYDLVATASQNADRWGGGAEGCWRWGGGWGGGLKR